MDGVCPEHGVPPGEVRETNWFFRLSRYVGQVARLVADGTVDVVPAQRRREVLGFLAGEVHDLSVSRPAARAGGWGVPVPADPDQVVYVWFDALANYLTGLGWTGADGVTSAEFARWWDGDAERVHVVGKGIVRFHAVFWVAFLLAAGLPLPTRVLVHDYVTVDGAKVAKSGRQAADPAALVEEHGVDALRWWLLREPAPVGGTGFTVDGLVRAHDRDLANGVGNLVQRVVVLARRLPEALQPNGSGPSAVRTAAVRALLDEAAGLPGRVDGCVRRDDPRGAAVAVTDLVAAAGRLLGAEEPWHLVAPARSGDAVAAQRFGDVVGALLHVCSVVAAELAPFVPDGAARLAAILATVSAPPAVGTPDPAFPRLAGRSSPRDAAPPPH